MNHPRRKKKSKKVEGTLAKKEQPVEERTEKPITSPNEWDEESKQKKTGKVHHKKGAWGSQQHPKSHTGIGLVLWPFVRFADSRNRLNF